MFNYSLRARPLSNQENIEDPLIVSVITTTYNSLEFLPRAILSIQNQTFKEYEHIIVDDGSDDGTSEYLKSIKDDKIKVIILPRSGRGLALNTGVDSAIGKYIAILDADDFSHPARLELQKNVLKDNPHFNLVASDYMISNRDQKTPMNDNNNMRNINYKVRELKYSDFLIKNPICHSSVMMRKNIFEGIQKYDESRSELFDYELWIRFLLSKKIRMCQISVPLVYRRIHGNQFFERRNRINYLTQTYLLKKRLLKTHQGSFYFNIMIILVFMYGLLPRVIRKKFMN